MKRYFFLWAATLVLATSLHASDYEVPLDCNQLIAEEPTAQSYSPEENDLYNRCMSQVIGTNFNNSDA